jgi:hypothetical protein
MDIIYNHYDYLCKTTGDINEHLPTLAQYASECETVAEFGVRGCVSSWAFCVGLLKNSSSKKSLFMNDIEQCDVSVLKSIVGDAGIHAEHAWINDLELDTGDKRFDLVFIDTWHVYAQLKRELAKYAPIANKYIIMHDTEIDGIYGETIRNGWNAQEQSRETGFPVEEINKGLMPAVNEFLASNNNWTLHKHYTNNNGLTVLKRTN